MKSSEKAVVVWVVAGTCFVVAYLGWPLIHWPPPEDAQISQTQAAWVQAIGSVLAVLIAVAVAAYQNTTGERLRKRARDDEEARLLEICYYFVLRARNTVSGMRKARKATGGVEDTPQMRTHRKQELRKHLAGLESIPTHLMPSPRSAMAMVDAAQLIWRALELVEPIELGEGYGASYVDGLWQTLEEEMETKLSFLRSDRAEVGKREVGSW